MKNTIIVLFLFVVIAFAGLKANAQKDICTVADPTGTPLNVRTAPNGRIVAKVNNGTVVTVEFYTVDKATGKTWAKIGVTRRGKYIPLGYVLDAYLNCN